MGSNLEHGSDTLQQGPPPLTRILVRPVQDSVVLSVEAFSLSVSHFSLWQLVLAELELTPEHVTKGYRGKPLTKSMKIFNYRHSRARLTVECAFGILAARWRMLHRRLILHPENAADVVRAACLLHNILTTLTDHFTTATEENIQRFNEDKSLQLEPLGEFTGYRTSFDASQIRMIFTRYLVSPEGSVPWQDKYAFVTNVRDDMWMPNQEPVSHDSVDE